VVDRGDVSRMRSRWALATILIASVVWPHAADSDQPCEVVPMPCTFESLPFKFKVADAGTAQLLEDVHALAESESEAADLCGRIQRTHWSRFGARRRSG